MTCEFLAAGTALKGNGFGFIFTEQAILLKSRRHIESLVNPQEGKTWWIQLNWQRQTCLIRSNVNEVELT